MNGFFKHAFVMLSGSIVAQAIPLLMMPILTRLYSPAEFGVYNSLLAVSGILAMVACLRFDLAVVLPTCDKEAANITSLAVLSSSLFSFLLFVAIYLLPKSTFVSFPHLQNMQSYSYFLPVFTLFLSIQQVFSFVGNREKRYRLISIGNILLQAVFVGFAVLMHNKLSLNELIVGRFIAVIISAAVLIVALRAILIKYLPLVSIKDIKFNFLKYRQFPLYNVPYSFAGAFSRDFLVLVLTSFGQLAVAGQLGLARTAINAPISFLSASLSQVFYREAAQNHHLPEFKQLVNSIFVSVALICVPLLVWGLYWGEELFILCFGVEWREAGHFAQLLMPVGILSLFTSWPERIFEVKKRQKRSLAIQLIFDIGTVAATYLVLTYSGSYIIAISTYVLLQTLYHITYLYNVIQLVGLSKNYFARFLFLLFLITFVILFSIMSISMLYETHLALLLTLVLAIFIVSIGYYKRLLIESKCLIK